MNDQSYESTDDADVSISIMANDYRHLIRIRVDFDENEPLMYAIQLIVPNTWPSDVPQG